MLLTKSEFFAAVTPSSRVEVGGTYDPATNTITATRVKINDHERGGQSDDVQASGQASLLNGTAGTFAVTVRDWEGFAGSQGMILNVTTNSRTVFKDSHGSAVNKDVFFTQLAQFGHVEVRGELNGTTIVATKVRVEQD